VPEHEEAEPPSSDPLSAPLVLVVDDVADNRDMYAEYMRLSGYRVVTACTAEEAFTRMAVEVPALIVMDLALPGLDGWEATRRIKSDARTRHVPVLIVTGYAMPDHLDRAMKVGADAVLTKPCIPDELREQVRSLLRAEMARSGRRRKSDPAR
jgi:CheY-like chemotaxis protein